MKARLVAPVQLSARETEAKAPAREQLPQRRVGPTGVVNNTEAQWKRRVNASFSRAAESYHAHADVQREIAQRLADRVLALPIRRRARVLEIGCGTGLLTQALRPHLPDTQWVATDISSAMLARCRRQLTEHPGVQYACMDGEWLAANGPFDLVCSSMAMQWFAQPRRSIPRLGELVRPGGFLCYSTLVEGTFREWKDAHQELGVPRTTLDYLSPDALVQLLPGVTGTVEVEPIRRWYSSAQQFVGGLKRLGANMPGPQAPLSNSSTLRHLLRYFKRPEGMNVTYEVAYAVFRKTEQGVELDSAVREPRAI